MDLPTKACEAEIFEVVTKALDKADKSFQQKLKLKLIAWLASRTSLEYNSTEDTERHLSYLRTLSNLAEDANKTIREKSLNALERIGDFEMLVLDKEGNTFKNIRVYSEKLREKNTFFDKMLGANMLEMQTRSIRIQADYPHEFIQMVRFLCTNDISVDALNVIGLLATSNQYGVLPLKMMAEQYLLQKAADALHDVDDAAVMYHLAESTDSRQLKAKVLEHISTSYFIPSISTNDVESFRALLQHFPELPRHLNENLKTHLFCECVRKGNGTPFHASHCCHR